MSEQICISIIVPFYNAEKYIKDCFDTLLAQDFKKSFEIIMVNDYSTDSSLNKIKQHNIPSLRLFSLPSNKGPSAARNEGIKNARGKYIFLLDADDQIESNTLTILYDIADQDDCDLVFSDFKRIENLQNQRNNVFNYLENQLFKKEEILEAMRKEIYEHNPSFGHLGLFGCNGRLIKSSILHDNKILFQEDLRFLEDKAFGWDILAYTQKVRYVRKQLYSYYVHPNITSGVIEGVNLGFPMSNFQLVKSCIENSLKKVGLVENKIKKFGDQALIFFIISLLVSYSRGIVLEKVNYKKGIKCRRKIIKEIIADSIISEAIKNYSPSKNESFLIPKAIAWRSLFLIEFACTRRGNQTVQMRRKHEIYNKNGGRDKN